MADEACDAVSWLAALLIRSSVLMRRLGGGKRDTIRFISFSVVVKSVKLLLSMPKMGKLSCNFSAYRCFKISIISSRLHIILDLYRLLLFREKSVVVLRGHVQSELNLDTNCGFGYSSEQVYGNLALSLIFLQIVDVLTRDDKNALLIPPEHINLFHLIREKNSL